MTGKRKQRRCRICRERPPWKYKNCPPDVCKRCYHKHIWPDLLAAQRSQTGGDLPPLDNPFGAPRSLVALPLEDVFAVFFAVLYIGGRSPAEPPGMEAA